MFAGALWILLWSFYLIAYVMVLVFVLTDVFRDDKLNGWLKAMWVVLLLFVPFLTGLIYVIVRGGGMAARVNTSRHPGAREDDGYRPAASTSPTDDIAQAKRLLDAGTITPGEFEALKSKALGNQYFGA